MPTVWDGPPYQTLISAVKKQYGRVALTVKVRPGDNLMVHKALNILTPGDILVATNDGGTSQALMGEIMITYAQQRRPAGPFKDGPGEINVPISCGGMSINPGDIIIGDRDGVTIVTRQDAEALLAEAKKYQLFDTKMLLATQAGEANRRWVEKDSASKRCEIIDDFWC